MKTSASAGRSKSPSRRRNYRPGRSVAAEWLEERLLLSSTLGEAPCSPMPVDAGEGQQVETATACQAASTVAELNFLPDPGVRIDLGAVPEVGIDQETGEIFLYFSIGPDAYLATSNDGGLDFSDPETPGDMAHDPRGVLMPQPDESGNPIWRRIRWDTSVGGFTSMVSSDGAVFSPEEGVRYDPAETEITGVYTVFNTSDGRVGLMYIGDKGTTTANVRLAYSTDNGQSFQLEYDNPLGDAGTHDEGLNQRDPAANLLDDGRIRVFTMVQGGTEAPLPGTRAVTSIFSFTSTDNGHSFEADSGVRLVPEDFTEFDVWSLNDPSVIQLPDGRYRMFIAGLISEEPDASDAHWAILSATTLRPDDPGFGGNVPHLQGPTGTITDPTPEFHWSTVESAQSYEFQIVRGPGGGSEEPGSAAEGSEVTVVKFEDGSIECRPVGDGPFPAVLYNHGGLGTAVGGDLMGTCVALAEAGYYARSELRPQSISLDGQLEDVLSGLDQLRSNPDVDSDQIAIAGFSRGGLLALQAAVERPGQIDSVLLFAPAPGKGAMTELLEDISAIEAPVEILIAENDDLLPLARDVEAALADAGKDVELTVYPEYGDDGHELFFEVRESYWNDVLEILSDLDDSSSAASGIEVDHLSTQAMLVGTHRPEILAIDSGGMLAVVVQPGDDSDGNRIKHQVYRYDSDGNQLGEPFAITWITEEYGEPADHRAVIVNDELVVVYQSLVFDQDAAPHQGPAEQYALNQSLMLARYSLEGVELFRGPIVAHVTDFSEENFPDHSLVPLEDSLLVSTGADNQIKLREVSYSAEVLNTHSFGTEAIGSLSPIGNSLLSVGDRVWMIAGSGMGQLDPNGISVLELDAQYQPTELASFVTDGQELTFPTGTLRHNGYTFVSYDAREAAEGHVSPEESPYSPRLMVLDADLNQVLDMAIGSGPGFAHVHPTLDVVDDELVIGWSMQADTEDTNRSTPQVQLERYDLRFVTGESPAEPGESPLEPGVGDPIVFQVVISDTSVTVPELAPGNYMAHVRALDESGTSSPWSQSLEFTVADGESETGPVEVRFDRETGHLAVRLQEAAGVSLQSVDGAVQLLVNGLPLNPGHSLPAAAVRSLVVFGSPGDDSIDLNGVTLEAFSNLAQVHVNGGAGSDLIIGSELADGIVAGEGHDVVMGGAGDDRVDAGPGDDVVSGGDGNDVLVGGDGDDFLNGKRGDDRLDGGPGNDTLAGGAGADALSGGPGNDVLNGHAGIDILVEQGNTDFVLGHKSLKGLGDDRLGNVEQARLTGGEDGNRIDASGFEGPVTIAGAGGDDVLIGGSRDDQLNGGPGNDRLNGRGGDDLLNGDDGDDRVMGGGGNDQVSGGRGDDVLKGQGGIDLLSEVADTDFELSDDRLYGRGRDQLSGIERARLEGGVGNNDIDARRFSGSTTLLGGAGDDLLRGGSAYDRIDGGEGDDRIAGFGGNDLLIGRHGRDVMLGGSGDDRIFGGAGNDVALGGEGHDRVNGQGGSHDTLAGGEGEDRLRGDAREIDEAFRIVADWIDEV